MSRFPLPGNLAFQTADWISKGPEMSLESTVAATRHSRLAEGSLLAHTVIPSIRRISSRDAGWSSLLIDVHSGIASWESYESVPTPDLRIGVTVSGAFRCDSANGKHWRQDVFTPGSIMLHQTVDPTYYRFGSEKSEDYRLALVYVPEDIILTAHEHLRLAGQSTVIPVFRSTLARDRAITAVTHTLIATMNQHDDLYAEATAYWLAMHVLHRCGRLSASDEGRSAGFISDARLARVLDRMALQFGDAITLEELAAEACISKFHFVRLFKDKTGQSPMQYLADLRLRGAKRLLLSSDFSVLEIARRCGFVSPSHLGVNFKRRFDMTPSQYRNAAAMTGLSTHSV
jgi:AraC family transcriptional regulator